MQSLAKYWYETARILLEVDPSLCVFRKLWPVSEGGREGKLKWQCNSGLSYLLLSSWPLNTIPEMKRLILSGWRISWRKPSKSQ